MDETNTNTPIGDVYPQAQLAAAFVTALTHEDPDTQLRAEDKIRAWRQVLAGVVDGRLTVGSRTPVAGWPAWVTPEVMRGGFATGQAAAGGPLLDHEHEAAERAGLTADRQALFLHHLTETGLAELGGLLDNGRYQITVPEEAALLMVAWLLRAGDRNAALDLLAEITPFAGQLRFTPQPTPQPGEDTASAIPAGESAAAAEAPTAPGAAVVHRATVGEVRDRLARRGPNAAVETMREAVTVWGPFADELLTHWLETVSDGRVAAVEPPGWRRRSIELLHRYQRLAASHTRCGKHRRARENLAILRMALSEHLTPSGLTPRRRGMLQCAVDAMVRRRGAPGTPAHTALRRRQTAEAARPTLHTLAQILTERLSALPGSGGLPAVEPLLAPVTATEAGRYGVEAGSMIPDVLARVVRHALAAPVAELVADGVITSAEVLAELVPQLVAAASALAYPDPALRDLMAATYSAFRNRRSVLLLNLEHQVRPTELPWVRAALAYRHATGDTRTAACTALVELGELALQAWPGTILPNPLIREMSELARHAGVDVPLTEELAADIFEGAFSAKFARAAHVAAGLLPDSLYARYYAIDYVAVRNLLDRTIAAGDTAARPGIAARAHEEGFAALCQARADEAARAAGTRRYRSAAGNGMVIEQGQILTTHNLAVLVATLGVRPAAGWAELARRAFTTVCHRTARAHHNPRPLAAVKDAAYAWRQMLFFISLCPPAEQRAIATRIAEHTSTQPDHVRARLAPVLLGLQHALDTADTAMGYELPAGARRLLGWSIGGHWMIAPPAGA